VGIDGKNPSLSAVLYLNLGYLGEEGGLDKGAEDASVDMVCLISPVTEEEADMAG